MILLPWKVEVDIVMISDGRGVSVDGTTHLFISLSQESHRSDTEYPLIYSSIKEKKILNHRV